MMKRNSLVVITFLALFAFPGSAHAYLDPGTGSYLTQILIASLLGGVYVAKSYWGRIRIFVSDIIARVLRRKAPRQPQ